MGYLVFRDSRVSNLVRGVFIIVRGVGGRLCCLHWVKLNPTMDIYHGQIAG